MQQDKGSSVEKYVLNLSSVKVKIGKYSISTQQKGAESLSVPQEEATDWETRGHFYRSSKTNLRCRIVFFFSPLSDLVDLFKKERREEALDERGKKITGIGQPQSAEVVLFSTLLPSSFPQVLRRRPTPINGGRIWASSRELEGEEERGKGELDDVHFWASKFVVWTRQHSKCTETVTPRTLEDNFVSCFLSFNNVQCTVHVPRQVYGTVSTLPSRKMKKMRGMAMACWITWMSRDPRRKTSTTMTLFRVLLFFLVRLIQYSVTTCLYLLFNVPQMKGKGEQTDRLS